MLIGRYRPPELWATVSDFQAHQNNLSWEFTIVLQVPSRLIELVLAVAREYGQHFFRDYHRFDGRRTRCPLGTAHILYGSPLAPVFAHGSNSSGHVPSAVPAIPFGVHR